MGISSIHMSDCSYNYIVKNLDKGKTIYFKGKSKLTLHPGAQQLKK